MYVPAAFVRGRFSAPFNPNNEKIEQLVPLLPAQAVFSCRGKVIPDNCYKIIILFLHFMDNAYNIEKLFCNSKKSVIYLYIRKQ